MVTFSDLEIRSGLGTVTDVDLLPQSRDGLHVVPAILNVERHENCQEYGRKHKIRLAVYGAMLCLHLVMGLCIAKVMCSARKVGRRWAIQVLVSCSSFDSAMYGARSVRVQQMQVCRWYGAVGTVRSGELVAQRRMYSL